VIDGPFGEAKEIVAGYWILQVTSMDEAIEWAKRLPFEAGGEPEAEGEIEIRQLFELDEFGERPAVERGRQLETRHFAFGATNWEAWPLNSRGRFQAAHRAGAGASRTARRRRTGLPSTARLR
jgi:hypothetical protein